MTRDLALRSIKLIHTIVWLIFALCSVAIPVFGYRDEFRLAGWAAGAVLVECLVLVFNRLECPLTGVAARYTKDREDNFDIYLPLWLARHNKKVFGILFVLGSLFTLMRFFQSEP